MSDFKTRLLEEREQLAERVVKLNDFLDSPKIHNISKIQHGLLEDQYDAMCDYLDCLNLRITDILENQE